MKFYLSSLKEYIDIDIQPSDIANKLTLAGVEVKECSMTGAGFENVVTAEILKIRRHPDADNLTICQVSNGREILSVVCGADNIREKDRVPLAMDGAVLPGGVKIRKSKIRGELSCGMLCSASELKIADDSKGIYILPSDTPLGRDLCEYLSLKNWKFELEITPNRADLLGMIGIAREIGALTNRKVKFPELPIDDGTRATSSAGAIVEILDTELCPRYAAAVVKGITVGESPDWLKKHIEGGGVRPINNIVDATNFVMMEWGQPLHAFDLSKIGGKKIVVRRPKQNEKIKTLDGNLRNLDPMDLVICDMSKPIAVAGIMGGAESEISAVTKDILIESAYFEPRNIRRTSKRLGLSSESSYRFERGVDPDGVRKALLRAVSLIEKLSGGKAQKEIIDIYPNEYKPLKMILKSSRIEKVLGVAIPPSKTKEILNDLGMDVKNYGDVDFEVTVPLFRGDIKEEIDLVEEVARVYGYHLIPTTLPQTLAEPEFFDVKREAVKTLENFLIGCGFVESRNYSFVPEKDNALFTGNDTNLDGEVLKVQNPISPDFAVMRQSILPSLVRNIAYNRARGIEDIKFFEIDRTFHIFNHQCIERTELAFIMTGLDISDRWDYKGRKFDYFDVKGIFEEIAIKFKLNRFVLKGGSSRRYLHPKLSSDIIYKDKFLGTFGLLHPDIIKKYELSETYVLELSIDDLISSQSKMDEYKLFSKFPSVKRDISMVIDGVVTHEEILNSMRKIKNELIKDISLFDHYKGGQIPVGKKSLTYRITYQSFDKTLTEEDVSNVHNRMLELLASDVKAELRK